MWLPNATRLEDPDHGPAFSEPVVGVVVHATDGGGARGTAEWAVKEKMTRSWHLLIERDGTTYQQVPLDHEAWHAGQSRWADRNDVNGRTIGIELANHLLLDREGNVFYTNTGGRRGTYRGKTPEHAALHWSLDHHAEGWWEPYPPAQLWALEAVLKQLAALGLGTQLVGHDEIAVPIGRKLDPGPLFPWELFKQWRPDAPRYR